MSLTIGHAEAPHYLIGPAGLREIWVRKPTDMFDPSVPLRVHKLPGDHATEWRHMVQTPNGCDLYCHPHIEPGTAWLVFEGGSFGPRNGRFVYSGNVREVKGRKRQTLVRGANLRKRVVEMTGAA